MPISDCLGTEGQRSAALNNKNADTNECQNPADSVTIIPGIVAHSGNVKPIRPSNRRTLKASHPQFFLAESVSLRRKSKSPLNRLYNRDPLSVSHG